MSVKQFDPMDLWALWDAVRQTSSMRLLVMIPSEKCFLPRKGRRFRTQIYAYPVREADPEIERFAAERGGVVIGYYRKDAPIASLVQDLGAALEEMG